MSYETLQPFRNAMLADVLRHLDRCKHGRHAKDPCAGCPGGQSTGNQILPPGTVIGHGLRGDEIVVPPNNLREDAEAWYRSPADVKTNEG